MGFARLLVAWFTAQSADGMRFAALPLLAYFTDKSPAAVGGVAAATSLPWLLIALPAGLVVDRLDPAKVIAYANLARSFSAVLVVVAIATDSVSIVLLAAVGFALTAAETFTDSAAQSLLVQMVPTEQLERANARFVSTENVGFDLVGPLSAGALFTLAHWAPFVVSALAFGVASGVVVTLTGSRPSPVSPQVNVSTSGGGPAAEPQTGGPKKAGFQGIRSLVRGAFGVVFADPVLRSLVITVAVLAAAVAAIEGVLVIYATGPLGLKAALFPTLLAAYSLGLLASAPFAARAVRRFGSGGVMLSSIGAVGILLMVLGIFPTAPVAWVCFVVMGAALGFWNILSATRRQRRTPRQFTAAVSSAFRTIAWGAVPLGAALGGVGAEHWGVARVFFVAGVVVLILGAVMAGPFLRTVVTDLAGVDDVVDADGLVGADEAAPGAIEPALPE